LDVSWLKIGDCKTIPHQGKTMPHQDDIKNLIRNHNRRLQKLKERKALEGLNTSPEILIEIEDIEDEVTNLEKELIEIRQKENLPKPNWLEVYHTEYQITDLRATEYGLELYLFDNREERKKGLQWKIPVEKLENIEVRVYPYKNHTESGLFAIGPKYDWLYSKSLFPSEQELYDAIHSMINKCIAMSKTM
jgi:hypothetical protein